MKMEEEYRPDRLIEIDTDDEENLAERFSNHDDDDEEEVEDNYESDFNASPPSMNSSISSMGSHSSVWPQSYRSYIHPTSPNLGLIIHTIL